MSKEEIIQGLIEELAIENDPFYRANILQYIDRTLRPIDKNNKEKENK